MAKTAEKGVLVFDPTPHCCGEELGHDDPGITCPHCGTEYNADDLLDAMIAYRDGQPVPKVRFRKPGLS